MTCPPSLPPPARTAPRRCSIAACPRDRPGIPSAQSPQVWPTPPTRTPTRWAPRMNSSRSSSVESELVPGEPAAGVSDLPGSSGLLCVSRGSFILSVTLVAGFSNLVRAATENAYKFFAGVDPQLREHFAQVVFHGARAEE